ncbi:MAG: ComF family protein [Dehalococcoidia bacterium]
MTGWLKQLRSEVIDLFFPRECLGCGKIGGFICNSCAKKLPRIYPPLCQRCGRPETSGRYCQECWGKQNNRIDAIRSVFVFEGTIRAAIHELKYRNLRAISAILGEYMATYYRDNGLKGDCLLPVPLHEKRIRERGYNQSELLAKEIAKHIGVPVKGQLVMRVRNNMPQARTSSAEERRVNMENVFSCQGLEVAGQDIIVVDDVCTSGNTLEACATVLKAAGAKSVIGFTLAREILSRS